MDYDLHEAADVLQIDVKTLRNWIERTGIELAVDPLDRRRRLIADDQLTVLASLYRRAGALGRVGQRSGVRHLSPDTSYPARGAASVASGAQSAGVAGAGSPGDAELLASLHVEVEQALVRLQAHSSHATSMSVVNRLQTMEAQLKVLSTIVAHIAGLPPGLSPENILSALGNAAHQGRTQPDGAVSVRGSVHGNTAPETGP